ncbi:MAG TPA: multiheme c-type cytochrome, partial [Bacteroidota bacterium]|nr:multiheme c-type cytochrome [Bacteroidota bacterium]
MKNLIVLLFSLSLPLAGLAQSRTDQCLTCHETLGDKPSEVFKHDIHFQKGITCAGCHGGDPLAEEMEQGMAAEKGFFGVPKGDSISQACAQCHSNAPVMVKEYNSILPRNQAEALATSVHGKLATSGKQRIAQCITCHGAHGIVSVSDPASPVYPLNVTKTCTKCHADAAFMRAYNPALPVDQLEKYHTSVHGMKNAQGDAKAAACASCHGSHDIRPAADVKSRVYASNLPTTCGTCHSNAKYMKGYGIPTDQVKKFASSVHGKALLEKHDLAAPACNDCHGNHGASPPGVESVSKVCGSCHALNADLFSSSPHKKAFDSRRLPECETCHGYHEIVAATDELLGVSPDAVCSRCHHENQNPKGYQVAKAMRQLTDSLELSEAYADSLVADAEQKGMEVSELRFKLRDARQARLESRTMVHAFNREKFQEVVAKGLAVTSSVAVEGRQAVDEYFFRRWGLGIATLIITIVSIS